MILRALLPPSVAIAESSGDDDAGSPYAVETEVVAGATLRRQQEFFTGRRCAREALSALGMRPVAIAAGDRREPLWPAGVVGSITHCTGLRAAAAARSSSVCALGIDAEPDRPVPEEVRAATGTAQDRRHLADLDRADPATQWARLLFSAKESIYKAWYPLTGRWLGFDEAEVAIDPTTGTFAGRVLVETGGRAPQVFEGRYRHARGLVVTAVVVPAAD